ncbi:MAG: RecX family transcriptional regulator [Caldilineaceae bacterium]
MTKKITSLQIQKRNKERVNVYLDGEYAFAISLMAAATLQKGQELSPPDIARLQDEDAYSKAYQAALRYLGMRQRTQREMEQYLEKKEYAPEVVSATVQRLVEQNYLDDAEFAAMWRRDRERMRPRGAQALRHELRHKGVADEIIEETVAELDEEALAWDAIQPKLMGWQRLEERALRQKLSGFLARRGFGYDAIRAVFERVRGED